MTSTQVEKVIAVNKTFVDGQKTVAVVLSYDTPIDAETVTTDTFSVIGRTVTGVEVADEFNGEKGNFVTLNLDLNDDVAGTILRSASFRSNGPSFAAQIVEPRIHVEQTAPISTASGEEVYTQAHHLAVTDIANGVADDFESFVFTDSQGRELMYNLYIPQGANDNNKLPLVVFMHDASAVSSSSKATLYQGVGAITWAEKDWQSKHPAFVLAPQYERTCAFDDFTVTWECEATAELIDYIESEYPVDITRVYGTGQSMGNMMLCELNCAYPSLFTACYLVAGQWNPERMVDAKNNKLWILVSEAISVQFKLLSIIIRK